MAGARRPTVDEMRRLLLEIRDAAQELHDRWEELSLEERRRAIAGLRARPCGLEQDTLVRARR